jgi:hypothetical protein
VRGGVTLHGLSVHAGERPAPGVAEAPPSFEARRLWAQISWLALLRSTLAVEELAVEPSAVGAGPAR